ncbi:MAG TPA: hypothetical protein VGC89_02110 [Pyrinomonadaceae bacterium]
MFMRAEGKMNEGQRSSVAVDASGWRWQCWHLWLLVAGFLIGVAFCLVTEREAAFGGWDGK